MEDIYTKHKFNEIEEKYNLDFDDKELLIKAFTHGSFNNDLIGNYQRMEFLGDAVLQMVVSDYMYRFYSNMSEGEMSKERGALVSEFSLAYVVRREELDQYILFGNSLKKNEVQNTNSYVSDVYESFVAAIYLDFGYQKAERFVRNTLLDIKDDILENEYLKDYKTELQEELQVNGAIEIKYDSINDGGIFKSVVKLEGIVIGEGTGKTKKQAEQRAAKSALENRV